MAKKVLGDDPFRNAEEPSAPKSSISVKSTKTHRAKRAPVRKTEAPREARARKPDEPKINARIAEVEVPAVEAESMNVEAAPLASAVPVTQALAPLPVAVADGPAPGSWQWWRSRQLHLSRAEDSAFLAHHDGDLAVDRFGRDPALAGRAEPIVDFLYRSWLRVSVRGLGHVPDHGRAILVAKHRVSEKSGLWGMSKTPPLVDAAVIAHAVRTEHVSHREVRPLVRPQRLYTPILGKLLRRLGGVSSELHDFAQLLDDDQLALAFVDDAVGAHTLAPQVLISLALVTGAPIVPVVVSSTIETAGRFGMLRPSRKTTLSFGAPLYPAAEFGAEGAEDDQLVSRLAADLVDQLS